jgi:phage tail protein X
MEHVPTARTVTVLPETVQTAGVVEAKATANPELAVALTLNGAAPRATLLSAPNEMACAAGVETPKDWVTGAAAAKVELPVWLAVMEHVPAARTVTVLPATVQTEGVFEAKVTANPELAVALTLNGATPSVTLLNAPKAIVCERAEVDTDHVPYSTGDEGEEEFEASI